MSDINGLQKAINHPIITGRPETARPAGTPTGATFGELLQRRIEQEQPQQLTFSRHARARTQQRGIELSDTDIARLDEAVGKAGDKGVTDTLVLMNNTAFIVNVQNRVVVTVMDGSESESNVFTNINGAVII